MDRRDLNERSPMRVFEKSIHGGLGRGHLGVVMSRPGVGKTALLVQVAIDDLLRERRVLHVSFDHAVDHVKSYYDEIWSDLAHASRIEGAEAIRLAMERRRLIYSLLGHTKSASAVEVVGKLRETLRFAIEVAQFDPDVIVVDGFDFASAPKEAVAALAELARARSIELWMSALSKGAPAPKGVPEPIDRFEGLVEVVVYLEPERGAVRLRVLFDRGEPEGADLHLRLDPLTMRIVDEDVPQPSPRPRDPRRFRLYSGGGRGTEAEFGACAERWGVGEVNYSFEGHRLLDRRRGVVVLTPRELKKGDFSLVYASRRLGRVLSDIPLVRSVLQSIWHQVSSANQVFVVGSIQDDGTVRGGTGWGAELARLWKKPLYVFDQPKNSWLRWSGRAWEIVGPPVVQSEAFCGTGTQHLTDEGRAAIRELFRRSFGPPATPF